MKKIILCLSLLCFPALAGFEQDFSKVNDVFRSKGYLAALPLADELHDKYDDPLAYAFMGFMAHSAGDIIFAYACYERYLELAPNGGEIEQVKVFHAILKITLMQVGYVK